MNPDERIKNLLVKNVIFIELNTLITSVIFMMKHFLLLISHL